MVPKHPTCVVCKVADDKVFANEGTPGKGTHITKRQCIFAQKQKIQQLEHAITKLERERKNDRKKTTNQPAARD